MNERKTAAPRGILITGASSGIGAALALACATPGTRLHLSGRDPARTAAVSAQCRLAGADVTDRVIDVRDAAAMAAWIEGAGHLDLVIANAGMGGGSDDGRPEPAAQVRTLFDVNLTGALNCALPAMERMMLQPPDNQGVRGRIAIVASIAAFVPGPGAATYCASKAALDRWTIATGHHARAQGIWMTSVCPGYVRTAMTAGNRFPMPGLMDPDRAARIILDGIGEGRRRIAFPWWMAAAARLVGSLPPAWSTALLATPPGKAPLNPHGRS
jgi:short-subunit dehydrogenase